MTNDIADMTEEEERQADREQGYERGYTHAKDIWDGTWGSDDLDAARERLACLMYRQPRQLLRQYIESYTMDWDLDDAYLSGFMAGMREALDERDADEWLSRLPGYH